MKKNIQNFTILFFLIIILLTILTNSKDVITSAIFSLEVWKNNIFPSLFPFFIISELLINYGFVNFIGKIFRNLVKKIFHLRDTCSFIIIMSILSGFPSSAKYITRLYQERIITIEEANHLITFTHFSNPLFILGTIYTLIHDKKLCFIIMISHYFGNIIIGIIFRKEYVSITSKVNIQRKSLINCLTEAINNSINTLTYILGTITIFIIFSTLIFKYIYISDLSSSILRGILELTQGVKYVSLLDVNIYFKGLLITAFLSFGGISIHMQVMGILENIKIKYSRYLLSRVLHVFISSILYIIITLLFVNHYI